MNTFKNNKGFGLLGLLLTVLIIGILLGMTLPHYQKMLEKNTPSKQGVNVQQIKKQLDDTMKKHEQDLNNYEKSLQGY